MSEDVRQWLEDLGLAKYTEAFEQNEITLKALPHLSEEDLKELGLPIGPRKIVASAIKNLPTQTAPLTPAQNHQAQSDDSVPERRKLTVMFCDLVGSTQLSERLVA